MSSARRRRPGHLHLKGYQYIQGKASEEIIFDDNFPTFDGNTPATPCTQTAFSTASLIARCTISEIWQDTKFS